MKSYDDNKENLVKNFQKKWKFVTNHPHDQIIGNPSIGVRTRPSLRNICNNLAFISQIEPKKLNDAIIYENWVTSMLISAQKVLFLTLFIIGFECFLYTNHFN